MRQAWRWLMAQEDGQAMAEYGLIIGLLSVMMIVVLLGLNGALTAMFSKISSVLGTAAK